jgi:hypothetical protein
MDGKTAHPSPGKQTRHRCTPPGCLEAAPEFLTSFYLMADIIWQIITLLPYTTYPGFQSTGQVRL